MSGTPAQWNRPLLKGEKNLSAAFQSFRNFFLTEEFHPRIDKLGSNLLKHMAYQ